MLETLFTVPPVIKASINKQDLVILVVFIQILMDVLLVLHNPYVQDVYLDIIYKTTLVILALWDAQPVYLQMPLRAKLVQLVTF